jgi:hypothetical protein
LTVSNEQCPFKTILLTGAGPGELEWGIPVSFEGTFFEDQGEGRSPRPGQMRGAQSIADPTEVDRKAIARAGPLSHDEQQGKDSFPQTADRLYLLWGQNQSWTPDLLGPSTPPQAPAGH